jgi:alanine racemase
VTGRPTLACIDRDALRGNLALVRSRIPASVEIMAVVKADGYGHGSRIVAPALADAGADLFGVATVDEGVELRAAGVGQPIVVLTGATRAEAGIAAAERLAVAVVDRRMARELAEGLGTTPLDVHLKIDSGMGRLGVAPEELPGLVDELHRRPQLRVAGVFSHFGNADSVDNVFTEQQLERFKGVVAALAAAGIRPRWRHLANSVATLTLPGAHQDLVRPGIVLYGIAPAGAPAGDTWRPVMHLRTKIWQLKSVPAGRAVSYGQTFVTRRPSRIAVLPIGYADGYGRALSNCGEVVVRGRRAPIVGAVCMDLTMVDVTDVAGVRAEDDVLLWGAQGGTTLSVDEVARWQGTISYEVLTRLGKRVPRVAV